MESFLIWMSKHGSWFMLISLAAVFICWRHLIGPLLFIKLFVVLAVLGEVVAELTNSTPNLYLLHGYTILEFNVIALFYAYFFGQFYPRVLVPGLMVLFTILAIANSIWLQPLSGFNTNASGLAAVLIIGFAVLCFYKMLAELASKRLTQNPVFWINLGLLLYFAGSLFYMSLGNALSVQTNKKLTFMVFGLHSLLMVLMHILLSIGIWYSPRYRQIYTS